MNWKYPYIFIVKVAYRAGHGCIGNLNCSFCEFLVAYVQIQSIVIPLIWMHPDGVLEA